jgi:hypothetical protein
MSATWNKLKRVVFGGESFTSENCEALEMCCRDSGGGSSRNELVDGLRNIRSFPGNTHL